MTGNHRDNSTVGFGGQAAGAVRRADTGGRDARPTSALATGAFSRDAQRSALALLILLVPLLLLTGCAFRDHRASIESLARQGQFEQAAAALDRAFERGLYDENNELLYHLDRGTLALYLGEYDRAFRRFDRAEEVIERNFDRSISRELGSFLLNENVLPYAGEPYEDQYANVFKLLIQLKRGNVIGGATVEARRLIDKAEVQRQRYVQLVKKLREDPDLRDEIRPMRTPVLVEEQKEGRFLESTLGTYLSVLTWTLAGEYDFQRTAAQRLLSSIELQQDYMPRVSVEPFRDMASLDRGELDLLLVALTGRGPTKRAETIRAGWGKVGTKVQWPVLQTWPSAVHRVVVRIDGEYAGELALVEDMSAAAAETYRRQLPLIYAKAIGRSVFKSIGRYILIDTAEGYHRQRVKQDKRNFGDDLLLVGAHIAGFLISETEQADLRSWSTMPGQAYVGTFNLPPGEYEVTIEHLRRSGERLGQARTFDVTIEPGRMAVITDYRGR